MTNHDVYSNKLKVQFSGHETFPLRHGWLKKAYDAVSSDGPKATSEIFKGPEAIVRFGVGKNMALAIRYWALACGIIEEESDKIYTTAFGDFLLGSNGKDPYLESKTSIWLIHWMLAGTNPSRATTWYLAFNNLSAQQFDRTTLQDLLTHTAKERSWKNHSAATYKRDVECFFRSYIPKRTKGLITEESVETPLSELSLITPIGRSSFRFNRGPQPTLPNEVFVWSILEYWREKSASNVLSVEQLTYDAGSPGRVFKLDENSVVDRLIMIDEITKGKASWSDTSGLRQVVIHGSYKDPLKFLSSAFPSSKKRNAA